LVQLIRRAIVTNGELFSLAVFVYNTKTNNIEGMKKDHRSGAFG